MGLTRAGQGRAGQGREVLRLLSHSPLQETLHLGYCLLTFNKCTLYLIHVRWVPCHHSMVRSQVADGGNTLQVWRVAANILNKQSRTADKG
jgi:hypothetical protein